MSRAIGVPVVRPSNTPDRIFTASSSRRCVTKRDWPGLRRSRSFWMSPSAISRPGGQPSTTQPMAGPWLSPKLVTQNSLPSVLPDIVLLPLHQFAARHDEHAVAAVLELRPDHRQV